MNEIAVVRAGVGLLIQDLGRPGFAHLGVPPSGALDQDAIRLANRLVGNPEGAAGFEVLVGGCVLVPQRSVRLALTGARHLLAVDGVSRPWGESVSVPAGRSVTISPSEGSLRSWLAIDGGIAVAAVLGSRATDTLTGLGPHPLAEGDAAALGAARDVASAAAAIPPPPRPAVCVLGIRLGPRDHLFTADAIDVLGRQTYRVSADANRVGVRLVGVDGIPLERRTDAELASEGIVTGAVQVPASGQPLVFLSDHPVTGGYPVIGVVDTADLALCAQLAPGDLVTFRRTR